MNYLKIVNITNRRLLVLAAARKLQQEALHFLLHCNVQYVFSVPYKYMCMWLAVTARGLMGSMERRKRTATWHVFVHHKINALSMSGGRLVNKLNLEGSFPAWAGYCSKHVQL